MKNFKPHKNVWRRIYESKIFIIILLILVIFFTWNIIELGGKLLDTEENRRLAEVKVEELRARKENMTKEIEELKTDKGVEKNIREKFGVVKEGEKVIIIVDDVEEEKEVEKEESSFLTFIKNWFKK